MVGNKRQRRLRKKINQFSKGAVSNEEIQHLKRLGAAVPRPKREKRMLRRFAAWWDTTPIEKTLEDIEHLLSKSALLSLLALIGNVGIIIAVVTYVGTEKQRRDAEILNAWQTITNAAGEPGNGGRIRALQFLNASPGANWRRKFPWFCAPHPLCTWKGESLAGINLSVDSLPELKEDNSGYTARVFLQHIELPGADLRRANLRGADLRQVNLQRASLVEANLQGTQLLWSNLQGAYMSEANLEEANMFSSKLQETSLRKANLKGANLWQANLQGADLRFANLVGANLWSANLEGTNLQEANLEGAFMWKANLVGAQNLTEEQLTQAKLCETTLPKHITLNPDHNCGGIEQVALDLLDLLYFH